MRAHFITPDNEIRTKRDPSEGEIREFIGGEPTVIWVTHKFMKRRPLYVHRANLTDAAKKSTDMLINIGATNLVHNLKKYQHGMKSRRGSEGEPEYESIHDTYEWEPLWDQPWIYGNAIFIEED